MERAQLAYANPSEDTVVTAFPSYRFGIESDWFATYRLRHRPALNF